MRPPLRQGWPPAHARLVVLGVVLVALGLLLAVFPQPLVTVGSRYRIWMGTMPSAASTRAARVAAVALAVVGIVLVATA